MYDTNRNWQSEIFRNMLNYERQHGREKFIFDVNQILNAYHDVRKNFEFLIYNNDPQLVAFIFSLISITHNKDDLSKYIKKENLSDYMRSIMQSNDEFNSNVYAHSFHKMPEKNLNIGENFVIPKSTLTIIYENDDWNIKEDFNLDDWIFYYDHNIISISKGIITSLKKGCTIIECINKKHNINRCIKINSGNIKQSNITEFFFMQVRNIIAHGRFSLLNSGGYDTIAEYNSFNMSTSDNRYHRGTQREMLIYDNNQLNIAYGGENSLNPKYVIFLAKTLYNKNDNCFSRFLDIFDRNNNLILIEREINSFSSKEKNDFETLIILAKFYINFIYNYDSYDKNNYNYDTLPIDNKLKNKLSNKEFIYEIRTAIAHGRYNYKNNVFNFWNFSKNDYNIKSFDLYISYDKLIDIIITKENYFYETMKYNPDELINNKKRVN